MTGKKANIMLVYKILKEYSDDKNPLTQQEIIDLINQTYGVELERKSVASSLAILRDELDYDINKGSKGGFYLGERLFEPSEVNYLTDAIFSSKALSGNYAKDLYSKVLSVLSVNYRKNYRPMYKCNEIDRTEDKEFFMTIDTITHALRHNRKISFKYMTYDENLNVVPRKKDGKEVIIIHMGYIASCREGQDLLASYNIPTTIQAVEGGCNCHGQQPCALACEFSQLERVKQIFEERWHKKLECEGLCDCHGGDEICLDSGEPITCPGCGTSFVPADASAECPECGLCLGV